MNENIEIENELTETELEETNGGTIGQAIGKALGCKLIGWGLYTYFSNRR
ncbi:MAG: hypothetical protein IJ973_02845 [Christensenellaceae bacterium]|nr:hypothetical protein [Christensenellaceae bacterium]